MLSPLRVRAFAPIQFPHKPSNDVSVVAGRVVYSGRGPERRRRGGNYATAPYLRLKKTTAGGRREKLYHIRSYLIATKRLHRNLGNGGQRHELFKHGTLRKINS